MHSTTLSEGVAAEATCPLIESLRPLPIVSTISSTRRPRASLREDRQSCSFSISSGRAIIVLLRSGWVRTTTRTPPSTA